MIGKRLQLSLGASALCVDVALHHPGMMNSGSRSKDRTERNMFGINFSYITLTAIQADRE